MAEEEKAKGGIFNSGYTSFKDMFDGGGPGRSGAMFSSKSLDNYGVDKGGYVSQAAIDKMKATNPDQYNADFGTGIGGLSNRFGARPYGSYAQERALGPQGTNIGTSGIADFIVGGGVLGSIMNKLRGHDMSVVDPNLPVGMALGSSPRPMSRPANLAVPTPMDGTGGAVPSNMAGVATPLAQNTAMPVQVLANGGLAGLARYMAYGGMV